MADQNPIAAWAADQPLGSFIEVGTDGTPSLEAVDLAQRGWKGLIVEPNCTKASNLGGAFPPTGQVVVLCAALDIQARPFLPAGGVTLAAGVHPNELFPFIVDPNPPLPEPRFVSVDIGEGSAALIEVLDQWVRFEAFKLTVPSQEEASQAGRWLSAGWKALQVEGAEPPFTIWAKRFI